MKDNEPQGGRIFFQILGPSPFHADFYVATSERIDDEGVYLRREERYGYDKYIVELPASGDSETTFSRVLRGAVPLIEEELSHYYQIIAYRVEQMALISDLSKEIQRLTEQHENSWYRRVFRYDFAQSKKTMLHLLLLKIDSTERLRSFNNETSKKVRLGFDAFTEDLRKATGEIEGKWFDDMTLILNELSDLGRSRIDGRYILYGALIGATVGALSTLALILNT